MNLKRIITALVGLPFVILLIVLGNKYMVDVVIAIVAMIAMYEYANCAKKEVKFISWVRLCDSDFNGVYAYRSYRRLKCDYNFRCADFAICAIFECDC